VAPLAERFEAKVDRSGEHHVWMGARQADGVGDRSTPTAPPTW
jgi:hypothetical protein